MLYTSAKDWADAPAKRVLLFGMSGLGKTHVSDLLRATDDWFHYSVDYRIGTRYLGEHIADNAKAEAMKVPFLAQLLRTDSIYIASNITFENLAPLSSYMGKPGDPGKGGVPIEEYRRRQALHAEAEQSALLDTGHFIARAKALYGYDNFVCDSSGSFCEVVDPHDPSDPILSTLSQHLLPVWIEGSEAHTEELIRRFDRAPKPMCYAPDFLDQSWAAYLAETGQPDYAIDPDAFIRWTYARAMVHRQPRYGAIAKNWGVTVAASDIAQVRDAADFDALMMRALEG
ncbi:MAG: ATPase [Rhodobacteraceae bacterium]|nr:ATPase [Paracoccaceae bacterium]